MENYNEQKARDYDKEPIIVKNYERLLISTITFLYMPMILGGYILSIWDLIFFKTPYIDDGNRL